MLYSKENMRCAAQPSRNTAFGVFASDAHAFSNFFFPCSAFTKFLRIKFIYPRTKLSHFIIQNWKNTVHTTYTPDNENDCISLLTRCRKWLIIEQALNEQGGDE